MRNHTCFEIHRYPKLIRTTTAIFAKYRRELMTVTASCDVWENQLQEAFRTIISTIIIDQVSS